jgi:hypothetical protein
VAPQSGANNQISSTVYNMTLHSNCEAQGVSKYQKKMWKIGLEAKINRWGF